MKLTNIIDILAIPAAMAIACTEAGRPGVGLVAMIVMAAFGIARASYRRPAAPALDAVAPAPALDAVAPAPALDADVTRAMRHLRDDQRHYDARQKAKALIANEAPAVATDKDIARAVRHLRDDQRLRDAYEKARAIVAQG